MISETRNLRRGRGIRRLSEIAGAASDASTSTDAKDRVRQNRIRSRRRSQATHRMISARPATPTRFVGVSSKYTPDHPTVDDTGPTPTLLDESSASEILVRDRGGSQRISSRRVWFGISIGVELTRGGSAGVSNQFRVIAASSEAALICRPSAAARTWMASRGGMALPIC